MSIITLTTDFGLKDYSVSAIKGRLYQDLAQVTIVDISHLITPYNVAEAAYILKGAYPNFPDKTVHIIGVDAEMTEAHKHLVVQLDNHYFIGADNGLFSLLSHKNHFENIIEIHHPKSAYSSFPSLDVFVDVASEIINGTPLRNLGDPLKEVKQWKQHQPGISIENKLIGHVIYIDHIGNLIIDITQDLLDDFTKKKPFEIIVGSAKITKIHTHYGALIDYSLPEHQRQKPGKAMAIFNSLGFLEIALYKGAPHSGGSAAGLLGLSVGDSLNISIN